MKCEKCKKEEGHMRVCSGDGRLHHHGMVHMVDGGLMLLCDWCAGEEEKKWKQKKGK